jgi:hypothetical protein
LYNDNAGEQAFGFHRKKGLYQRLGAARCDEMGRPDLIRKCRVVSSLTAAMLVQDVSCQLFWYARPSPGAAFVHCRQVDWQTSGRHALGGKRHSLGIKKPRRSGVFCEARGVLDYLYFFSLHAFLAFSGHERYGLTFFQAFEAIGLDSFEVHEQVSAAVAWSDEAEAFFIVEPFNGTSFAISHGVDP